MRCLVVFVIVVINVFNYSNEKEFLKFVKKKTFSCQQQNRSMKFFGKKKIQNKFSCVKLIPIKTLLVFMVKPIMINKCIGTTRKQGVKKSPAIPGLLVRSSITFDHVEINVLPAISITLIHKSLKSNLLPFPKLDTVKKMAYTK